MIEAVRTAITEEMERDERVLVMGEDVGRKGGVFGATDGLYARFGESRVLDTPLAESAIVGLPETGLGTVPGWGGTERLVELIGPARAKEVVMGRRHVDAATALSWGAVTAVAPAERAAGISPPPNPAPAGSSRRR